VADIGAFEPYKSLQTTLARFVRNSTTAKLDPEHYSITEFMKYASKETTETDKVLDAGAGSCPYKKFFIHANYESTDFDDIFDKQSKRLHDFICSLDDIPKPDNSYDVIISTQVLEHVPEPQKVITEFYRILKPKGKLFLTAPQGWGIHGEPYHFFNFTRFGLELLFNRAGFRVVFIKPRGGIFWYLAHRISIVPSYLSSQYVLGRNRNSAGLWKKIGVLFLRFACLLSVPFCRFLVPLTFFYLDKLDKKQEYTLGYACYCTKG
jgi:SAM-dependent methyltransferase